jgi:hypothetical protein
MDALLPGKILDLVDLDMRASTMNPYRIWAPRLVEMDYGSAVPPGGVRYEAEIEYRNPIEALYPWQIKESANAVSYKLTNQVRKAAGRHTMLYLTEKPYLTVTSKYLQPEKLWSIRIAAIAYTFPVGDYTTIKGDTNETD